MNDCEYGEETGRVFIHDDSICELVNTVPQHDEWHLWTEFKGADGEMTYVSDHEGYALDAEEFGPIEAGITGRIIADREEADHCQAGTFACSIDHRYDPGSCEGW